MDFDLRGELLWSEWQGEGYQPSLAGSLVYSTTGHVSLADDVVSKALASAVQRDGVADSVGRAFIAIQPFSAVCGYSGEVDGLEIHACSDAGETYYGDVVDEVVPTTWVEVLP
jgi:hypothetical protein